MIKYLLLLILSISAGLHSSSAYRQSIEKFHEKKQKHLAKQEETKPLWERKYLTGNWGGARSSLAEKGITFGLAFVTDILGNPIGGKSRGFAYAGQFSIDMNIDFGKTTALKGLEFYVSTVWRTGTNLSAKKIGNAFNVAQVYGGQTVRLNELYLRQHLFDKKVLIKAGMIDTSNDFLFMPVFFDFVNLAFNGNPGSIFFNTFFSSYPFATWGAFLYLYPVPSLSMKFGIANQNENVEKNSNHGFDFSFHNTQGVMWITEWGYHLHPKKEPNSLWGDYYVGAYYVTGDLDKFSGGESRGDFSYYFMFDQMIYRVRDTDRGLMPFGTFVFTPQKNINTFPFFFLAGFKFYGPFSSRPHDSVNFGVAYGSFSSDLRKIQNENRKMGLIGKFGDETQDYEMVLELTYWLNISQWLQIGPDIQYIVKPNGLDSIPNALVIGAQVNIVF